MTRTDDYLNQMLDLVNEHGIAVQGVFSSVDDPDPGPPFAYTVGLAAIGQPEFIAFGLPFGVAHALLNDLGLRVFRGEVQVAAGDTVHHLVRDYPVRLLAVRDSTQHLTISNRLYGGPGYAVSGGVAALQMVFPDAEGCFPWEKAHHWQPLLGEPEPGREVVLM